ncbi:hypothetical protein [Amphibacillus cookii]|uniref:hypothetical protein n=1 Tax=Amphibacillus cookii TaxID=767787 RepID=UPI00195BC604|nr:hypothetical protein [Amphibacillus cookii]MBM7541115.1 hypothetical protein [Amphibacillus cookii]
MMDALMLGFKDLFKNKRLFFIFEACLLMVCVIIMSVSFALIWELDQRSIDRTSSEAYTVIPTSNDMTSNSQLISKVNPLLNKGGRSFFHSEYLTSQMGLTTVIVIDSSLNDLLYSDEEMNQTSYAKIFTKADLDQTLMTIDFPEPTTFGSTDVSRFDERIFDSFFDDEVIIVLLHTNELGKWMESTYGSEIFDLVDNVQFTASDKQNGLVAAFEAIFDDSFLTLQPSSYQNDELRFILLYVFPTIAFVIAALLVALTIMYISLLKKLYREYTIHLISGATLKAIYARNSVFIIILIAFCLLGVSVLNGFELNDIFGIISVILLLIFFTFELLLYVVLKKRNISITLKGVD